MKWVAVMTVGEGLMGTLITVRFEKYVGEIGIEMRVWHTQETALLGNLKDIDIGTWVLSIVERDTNESLGSRLLTALTELANW